MIYSILDPTGNITALVESPVPVPQQPAAAAAIMERHPEVEQVGFVSAADPDDPDSAGGPGQPVRAALRMAGGEFCGNASMCAAVLYLRRKAAEGNVSGEDHKVFLRVSGAEEPVEVSVRPSDSEDLYLTDVWMPEALEITDQPFRYKETDGVLPLVRMQGISHILIDGASPFFALQEDRNAAEEAAVNWCTELGAEGLGLMFLEKDGISQKDGISPKDGAGAETEAEYTLVPLVYIPGSSTIFWENSCASGSSAAGMALARQAGGTVRVRFREPGGCLGVESGPDGTARLFGQVRMTGSFEMGPEGTAEALKK